MPLVYLDNCALQRPLDDRGPFRVRVEAEAVEAILREIDRGTVRLLVSDVLAAEVGAAPDLSRRDFARSVLDAAHTRIVLTPAVESAAIPFGAVGVRGLDALHLASALVGGADFFCSTDDRLLKRAPRANQAGIRIVTPPELALALEL